MEKLADRDRLRRDLELEAWGLGGFPALFAGLDQVAFFVKDRCFRIVFSNRAFFERFGFREELDIVGKNDFELFPRPLAAKFRADDERVLADGVAMPRMLELFLDRHGLPGWYMTDKLPLIGKDGRPVGIIGTVQRYDQARGLESPDRAVAAAVQRMLENPGELRSLRRLAGELGLSHRQFDRRFKAETGMTPRQFLLGARIQHACRRLLESGASLSEIGLEAGFCDQSAFTARFRERMGMTPLAYRRLRRR